ncbi:uncharacterized protein LOC116957391 [Petromyzon marinus]|uniref:uncharacterized protein LOC116957391 n=1 Tax=Petromyzon marinus TaxID=7757 RepID=UPI003F72FC6D
MAWMALFTLPLITQAEQGCHVQLSQVQVNGIAGSSALIQARVITPDGCEVTKASWSKNSGQNPVAKYDASTQRWTPFGGSDKYLGRVELSPAVVMEASGISTVSLYLQELRMEDDGFYLVQVSWSRYGMTWLDSSNVYLSVRNLSVSKPEVSPRDPVVHVAGGSLRLRCLVHQGSPPIFYSWLRGDASSGGNLTAAGVHTETWTLHDARHGDRVACEVSKTAGTGETNTTTERSDVVTVTTAAPGDGNDIHTLPHYTYWVPLLIVTLLVLIAIPLYCRRLKERRQAAAEYDSSSPPPPPPLDYEGEAVARPKVTSEGSHPSRALRLWNFSSKNRPHSCERGGRQASAQYEVRPPEQQYQGLDHSKFIYDNLELSRVQDQA